MDNLEQIAKDLFKWTDCVLLATVAPIAQGGHTQLVMMGDLQLCEETCQLLLKQIQNRMRDFT